MTAMIVELYEALRAAGAPEEKAQAAPKALADHERRFDHVDTELATVRGEIKALEGQIVICEVDHRRHVRRPPGADPPDLRGRLSLLPADRGRSALRLRLSRLPESRQLLALLDASRIGVELSDEDQLWPEQSTSAIVLHHPQARYFNVWRPPGDGLTFEAQDLPRPAPRIKVGR